MPHLPDSTPAGDLFPDEGALTAEWLNARLRQIATQEQQLADARAAFRRERDADRDRQAADRDEADRLLREAQSLHQDASRRRDRTRRLAYRYARRVRQKWATVRAELETQQHGLDEARGRLSAEIARFEITQTQFHVQATEQKDRLREGWAALDSQRRRATSEWAATADDFVAQQASLAAREKALAMAQAATAAETTALRAEAEGLESRIQNARAIITDLERERDRLRAEVQGPVAPADPELPPGHRVALDRAADRDLTQWAAELDTRDLQLTQEKSALATARAGLARKATDLADQRQVLAEQFTLLAAARGRWQETERRTIAEMEELARGLRRREQDLDALEDRLIRVDARRREEAYELWQLRLRLEAWQSKLTAVDREWHAGRELRDTEYARRIRTLAHRETEVEDLLTRWERVRDGERERLRSELRLWTEDRERLGRAAEGYDRQSREVLAELMAHAARAMASEEWAAEAAPDAGTGRTRRRLEVLRKRWEQVFRRKLDEIDSRRAAATADLARLDERYREFHRLQVDVIQQQGSLITQEARADAAAVLTTSPSANTNANPTPQSFGDATGTMVTLRSEFERMAAVLIDAGVPETPDSQLPWAADEQSAGQNNDILPFSQSRAA